MRAAVLSLVALAACELVFPLRDPTGLPCDPTTPFPAGEPVALTGAYSVEGARFTPGQEVAWLSLCPMAGAPDEIKTGCDVFQTSFITSEQAFGIPVKLEVSEDGAYDAYPTVDSKTRFMLFSSDRSIPDREDGPHLFYAAAVNSSFSGSVAMELDPGIEFSNEPYVVGDGSILYYGGSPAMVNWDLYRATGAPPQLDPPTPLSELNTDDGEFAPVVSDDELEVFFASNRRQPGDDFALDVYTATRTLEEESFSTPQLIAALSTDGVDWPVWISPDRCSLYYINKPYLNGVPQVGVLSVSRRSP